MSTVADNLDVVRERVARASERSGRPVAAVKIVAVTKTVTVPQIEAAIRAGITILGENRVQEALSKYESPGVTGNETAGDGGEKIARGGIELHMIGALQRNKARPAAHHFDAVQSVDRPQLASALDDALAESETKRVLPVLLEVNVTGEATKSGVAPADLDALVSYLAGSVRLRGAGLMMVARFGADERELRVTFSTLRRLLDSLCREYGDNWRELSMGMSDDYEIAVEEGATLVRLGRAIFGERRA